MNNPNYGSVQASVAYSFEPELSTGRATMSVPLAAPSGIRGMAPSLALMYQSDGGNGWVGYGWRLEFGSIQRFLKNGVPSYNDADVFFLDFQGANSELVKVSSGVYRLKEEGAFLKMTFNGTSWEVWDKDGTKYTFGSTASSRTSTSQGVFAWHLDRIEDTLGNYLTVTYLQDRGGTYLQDIRYAGNSKTGFAPPYRISFLPEPRPDVFTHYRIGAPVTMAGRLARVEMFVDNTLIRKYRLEYVTSSDSGRSLLARITQVGADGSSPLPPVVLSYSTNPGGWRQENAWNLPDGVFVSGTYDQGRRLADVTGDGRADLAVGKGEGSDKTKWELAAWVNTGSGWLRDDRFIVSTGLFIWEHRDDGRYLVDLNADGRPEALAAVVWYPIASSHWKTAYATRLCYGCWGWSSAPQWNLPDGYFVMSLDYVADQGRRFADLNGDNLADLLIGKNAEIRTWMNTGNGWKAGESAWNLPAGETFMSSDRDQGVRLFDLNSDGLTDLLVARDGTRAAYVNTGRGWQSESAWNLPGDTEFITQALPRGAMPVEINGDGMIDVVFSEPGNSWALLNTGSGWRRIGWSLPDGSLVSNNQDQGRRLVDINGDGVEDLLVGLDGYKASYLGAGRVPDLLVGINNGLGGVTTMEYTPSTAYDNRGGDGQPKLPLIVQTVSKVTASDGLGHSYVTQYTYRGGYYDPTEREYRGFNEAKVIDAEGNTAITRFRQGPTRKVLPYEEERLDAAGNKYSFAKHQWNTISVGSGAFFTYLADTTATTYDGDGTLKQTAAAFEYDAFGNHTRTLEWGDTSRSGDERQTLTEYAYNLDAYIVSKPATRYVREGATASGRILSQAWFYYDGATTRNTPPTKGLLTQQEGWLEGGTNPLTKTTYDEYGNPVTVTDPRNNTTTTTFDSIYHQFPIEVINPKGHRATATYDSKTGQVLTSTDPNNVTTKNVYDTFGRLTAVIGPNDSDTKPGLLISYDLNTVPSTVIRSVRPVAQDDKLLTTYTFADGLGRGIQTRSPSDDPSQQVVTDNVSFNTRGLIEAQYLPKFAPISSTYIPPSGSDLKVTTTYDAVGRPKVVTNPDGSTTSTIYQDWTVTTIDANGHQLRNTMDAYGRLGLVEEFNGAQTYLTIYLYDLLGQLTEVRDHVNNKTTLAYDTLGRKRTMNDPDMGLWAYTYDLNGNLKTQTDARGLTTTFTYDELNRLTLKTYSNSQPSVTYTYDNPGKSYSKGRLTEIADGSGASSFEYDNLGRLTKETKTIDATPYLIQRAYDALGRLTSIIYPDSERVDYTYGDQGGIKTVKSSARTYVSDMTYTASGQITQITYGNGTATTHIYDPKTLRLKDLKTTSGASTIQDFSYGFDTVGNLLSLTDRKNTASQSFQYDDLNRLISATGAYGAVGYTYDPIGNMTAKEGVTQTYGLPKPHAIKSRSDNWTFTYDANGHMKSRAHPSQGTTTYTVDAENRLTQVAAPSGTTSFVYDGDGGRVKQVTASGTTVFLGQSYEQAPSGTTTKYIFAGSQRVCAKDSSGALRYYHGDHLGSSNVITDGSGAQVELAEYTPYGSLSRREGPANVPQKFTGQRLDASTGLYFYNARYYDPLIGRFVSADPIVPVPGDPQALNRYSYVRNNPLKYIDPTGHGWFKKFWRAIVGAVSTIASILIPPLAPAIWAVNFAISAVTAIQQKSVGGFLGGLIGGAIGGALGQSVGLGIASSLGDSAFTFLGGALGGAAEFGLSGFGAGFGAAVGSGASFSDALRAGGAGAASGAIMGAAIQGSYMAGWQQVAHGYSIAEVGIAQGGLALQRNDPGALAGIGSAVRARTRGRENLYLHGTDLKGALGIEAAGHLYPKSWVTLPEAMDRVTGKMAISLNPADFRRFTSIAYPKGEYFALVVAPKESVMSFGLAGGGAPQFRVYGDHTVTEVFPNVNQ